MVKARISPRARTAHIHLCVHIKVIHLVISLPPHKKQPIFVGTKANRTEMVL